MSLGAESRIIRRQNPRATSTFVSIISHGTREITSLSLSLPVYDQQRAFGSVNLVVARLTLSNAPGCRLFFAMNKRNAREERKERATTLAARPRICNSARPLKMSARNVASLLVRGTELITFLAAHTRSDCHLRFSADTPRLLIRRLNWQLAVVTRHLQLSFEWRDLRIIKQMYNCGIIEEESFVFFFFFLN